MRVQCNALSYVLKTAMTVPVVNQAAVEVATLTQRTVSDYFAHVAAMYVARDPRAEALAPAIEPGQHVPILRVPRRDGDDMQLWFNHYLNANRDLATKAAFDLVWLRGALLTVSDALGDNQWFGHAPETQMIRHLRNGIAHKNRFTFRGGKKSKVIDPLTGKLIHPANIFRYAARQVMPRHEIDTHLDGVEVLGAWGGPDAIVDCLTVLGVYLWDIGHGTPLPAP